MPAKPIPIEVDLWTTHPRWKAKEVVDWVNGYAA